MGKLIATDINGIIHELRIKEEDFLLSFYELVVNAIQAIDEKGNTRDGRIDVYIERENAEANLLGERAISSIKVVDNGIGFTEENFDSFTRSHSTKKADIGGKGVGRFAVLSVFDKLEIKSTRQERCGEFSEICFSLSREGGLSDPIINKATEDLGTVVLASQLNPVFKNGSAAYNLEKIADSILDHCLLYFLNKAAPTIILHEGEEFINLTNQFSPADFINNTYSDRIKGHAFSLFFIKENKFKYHQYSFCANNRVVRSKRISTAFPLFSSPIVEGTNMVYIWIFVVSSYLDEIVNMSRNELDFPKKRESDTQTVRVYEADLDALVVKAMNTVFKEEVKQRKEIVLRKVAEFMAKDSGLPYRHLTISDDFLEGISDDVKEEEIDERLHALSYKKNVESRNKCQKLLSRDYSTTEDYQSLLKEVVDATTDEGNLQLAQYVAKRKTVIALFEKYLAWLELTKQYTEEKSLHNLLFVMGGSNSNVSYEKHNLWLLDDRLTFFGYITSDKAIRLHAPMEGQTTCGKETDIAIYDVPFVYGEKDDYGTINAVLIFELKRPDRIVSYDEFGKQMREQTNGIRSGKMKNEQGHNIRTNENVPIYFYYVCDENAYGAIKNDAKMEGFAETPFHSLYRTVNNTTQEILTYGSMLANARRRNYVFFKKLGIEGLLNK